MEKDITKKIYFSRQQTYIYNLYFISIKLKPLASISFFYCVKPTKSLQCVQHFCISSHFTNEGQLPQRCSKHKLMVRQFRTKENDELLMNVQAAAGH